MAPAAYAAEDGLVGHQWEERPLVLGRLYVRGGKLPGRRGGVVGGQESTLTEAGEGRGDRDFPEEKSGKGITFEM